jgi:hypothetical protein
MEHNFKKAVESIRETRLSQTEKSAILARLSAYQAAHPPKAPLVISPFASFFTMKNAYAFAATLLLIATGTVAHAAESSLPGEALYAVKVKVNEPLRGALSFSASAKAEWETKKLERRLEEAEKLALKGKFDSKALAEVEKHIDRHFDDHDSWKKKDKKDKDNANAIVPSTLFPQKSEPVSDIDAKAEEYKTILEDIKSKGDDDQKEKIEKLERKLEEKANRKTKAQNSDENQPNIPNRGKKPDDR